MPPEPIRPDADLRNADWTKRTWDVDLPQTAADIDLIGIEALRTLAALPVFDAAPQAVKDAVAERLEAEADLD